jgi:hypothetical protein
LSWQLYGHCKIEVCYHFCPVIQLYQAEEELRLSNREHLYRVHFAQWKCPRCKAGFPNALQFQYHCEAFEACPPQLDRDPETGYSLLVYNLLKVRKKSAAEEEGSERWKEMYQRLFPNEPVPSPCKSQSVNYNFAVILTISLQF